MASRTTSFTRIAACALALLALLGAASAPSRAASPGIGPCPVFPKESPWNQRIDDLPRARNSKTMIRRIGDRSPLHPDFGSGLWRGGKIGIPFVTVGAGQQRVPVVFSDSDYSDHGLYPIPPDAPIEDRPDRHALVVDLSECRLYELYQAEPGPAGLAWRAGSGATWDLRSPALRPNGWTSADAAGLPIFPGLVRYDEVRAGSIRHALRLAVPMTRRAWVYPARHASSDSSDPTLPAMGQRLRLKAGVDASRFPPQARVVVRALQRYGVMVADNGAPWHLTGAPDPGWNMGQVFALDRLRGSDFEVVDTSSLPRPAP